MQILTAKSNLAIRKWGRTVQSVIPFTHPQGGGGWGGGGVADYLINDAILTLAKRRSF